MMHRKRKNSLCAKIGIVMPLLIFKIQCINLGGEVSISMNYQVFNSKNETFFELPSITKKGKIKSASRPLIDFDD
jgi:hypothetical protein